MPFLVRLLVNAVALWVATKVVPGVTYEGGWPAFLGVALIFGAVNAFIRPILRFLTFPIIIITIGLFSLVVNALMLTLTSNLAGVLDLGFHVAGFKAALFGALVVSVVSTLLSMMITERESKD